MGTSNSACRGQEAGPDQDCQLLWRPSLLADTCPAELWACARHGGEGTARDIRVLEQLCAPKRQAAAALGRLWPRGWGGGE